MHTASILICGAGIVGLTLARELVRRGHKDILVIDKESEPGRHASGRNSGVLHAGIYYPPGSLRAVSCLRGNRLMREYCREKGLDLNVCGKVIVAREPEELDTLLTLCSRARANGADVSIIDEGQLAEIEPNARTVGMALHSRDTAVVDPKQVLASLRGDLETSGAVTFRFGTTFLGAKPGNVIATSRGEIGYGLFVNAAGAFGDHVAHAFGVGEQYRMIPFKGIYRKLRQGREHLCRGNIYPVPNIRNPFLGVHFTRNVHGDVYLGPTAIPALGRENYGVLAGMDREFAAILLQDARLFLKNTKFRRIALEEPRKYFASVFFRDARRLVHELEPDDLEPSPKVGIRPQLIDLRRGDLIMDYMVERRDDSVHVLNAISPAFTSSLYFASMLAEEYLPL